MNPVRVLSMWQPWATLHVSGMKRWETRSWKPHEHVLGRWVAIHAAKHKYNPLDYAEEFRGQLLQDEVDPWRIPFGCVVGFVRWTRFERTETIGPDLSNRELIYGDYQSGRWAWFAEEFVGLKEPVRMVGRQGFWGWPDGPEMLLAAQRGWI